MKTLICQQPGVMEYVEKDIPTSADNEVLLKIKAVGICGTDIHAFAVALFLDNKIGFSKIGLAVGHVLETIPCKGSKQYTVREIDETDKTARELVLEYCKSR